MDEDVNATHSSWWWCVVVVVVVVYARVGGTAAFTNKQQRCDGRMKLTVRLSLLLPLTLLLQ